MTSRTQMTFSPPVMEARRWIEGVSFPAERPLLNVSQAAPIDPPPEPLRLAMADALLDTTTHLYGPVLGLPSLRQALAENWGAHYGGQVDAAQIAITAGCNQAFAAVISSLTDQGDEVILPTPWYFNHKMWLDMAGVTAVPLPTDTNLLPSPEDAAKLITDRTKAIAIVSPNNPAGVEYPAALLDQLFDLCQSRGIKLILDETYRDFDSRTGAPHALLSKDDAQNTLVQLYSFSKAYRLTGHRVGAIITSPNLLKEVEKFLDTVAICAPQLGQKAAQWGLENLSQWLAGERQEILDRRAAIEANMPKLEAKGWKLLGLGAYFAYVEHPFAESSADLAQRLVADASILALPGTMFTPATDPSGQRQFRFAFANIDAAGIAVLFDRLAGLDWPLAGASRTA